MGSGQIATGVDKTIKYNGEEIGLRKALVFYIGKPPKGTFSPITRTPPPRVPPLRGSDVALNENASTFRRTVSSGPPYLPFDYAAEPPNNSFTKNSVATSNPLEYRPMRLDDELLEIGEIETKTRIFLITGTFRLLPN
ncbi:NAC domain superfamily [Abeliophyllum distichum]|uniref:NAC domain superfamily n=1 Tax=Abeliophyllum distichum TaxID=126358 RepID=A0ABD1UKF8_9LAMI